MEANKKEKEWVDMRELEINHIEKIFKLLHKKITKGWRWDLVYINREHFDSYDERYWRLEGSLPGGKLTIIATFQEVENPSLYSSVSFIKAGDDKAYHIILNEKVRAIKSVQTLVEKLSAVITAIEKINQEKVDRKIAGAHRERIRRNKERGEEVIKILNA